MSTVERTALDGSVVTLNLPDARWNETFRSDCRVKRSTGGESDLCSGSLAHADWIAAEPDFGPVTFRDEYDFQGGRLLIGSGPSPKTPDGAEYMYIAEDGSTQPVERWLAAWYGNAYSLHAQAEGGPDKAQSLLSLLDQLALVEQSGGLTIKAAGHSAAEIYGVAMTQQIPSELLLSVQPLGPDQAKSLPSWEGNRVKGGELFIASHETHGEEHELDHDYLVLVTDTAVVTGTPLEAATEASLVAYMSDLEVTWEGTATSVPARALTRRG
jgi:hypothetical protein